VTTRLHVVVLYSPDDLEICVLRFVCEKTLITKAFDCWIDVRLQRRLTAGSTLALATSLFSVKEVWLLGFCVWMWESGLLWLLHTGTRILTNRTGTSFLLQGDGTEV
jgi:hypothetical protein